MLVLGIVLISFGLLLFGYPLFLWLLAKAKRRPVKKMEIFPFISIIIPSFNEGNVIERKIHNILALEYPRSQYEVIVVDSGSSDDTPQILEKYCKDGSIISIRHPKRLGKPQGINVGLAAAKGEIVVLTDADAFLNVESLKMLVRNFADENVGAVVGNLTLDGNEPVNRMNSAFYKIFRQRAREWESEIDSASFFSGELLAFRKSLVDKIDEEVVSDDQFILFEIRKKGYRGICEKEAFVFERDVETLRGQINHKRRTLVGTLQVFSRNRSVLFNPKYGFFGMLIAPAYLLRIVVNPFLLFLIPAFIIFYAPYILLLFVATLVLVAIFSRRLLMALLYGVLVQLAVILGIVDYATRNYTVLWTKKGK